MMMGKQFGVDSMYPFCLMSSAQAAMGRGVGINSWHALGPLVSNEHCPNATAYINIIAKWAHPILATFSRTRFPQHDSDFKRIFPTSHLRDDVVCFVKVHLKKAGAMVTHSCQTVTKHLNGSTPQENRLFSRPTWTFCVLQARCTK